jgi:CubicO group peptidase (beta-lactamase class C family)
MFRATTSLLAVVCCLLPAASANDEKPVFPGQDWERITKPETAEFSSAKLDVLRAWLKTQQTTAMMVVVGGRVLLQYGDVKYVSILASVRKSVLGMLYGKYVVNGTINLEKTVKELGLDDVQKFLPVEEKARLEWLLMSRSGIYHPDSGDTDPTGLCPARGSQFPGAFYCYNNWDFNAAGTTFEKLTGKNIYDALESDLARPIGMQDFDRAAQKKDPMTPYSVHPIYHMYLSTRDMARLGLLMLRHGNWNGKELIHPNWVKYMTTLVTPVTDLFPRNFREEAYGENWRWGYGAMWWVWDQPQLPRDMNNGHLYGAYCAMGTGGQYITVIPVWDMVVVHKVDPAKSVSNQEYYTMLQMLFASYCGDSCR